MHFTALLKLLLEFAPLIVNTVVAVEQIVPGKKQGTRKLKMVVDTITAAATAAPTIREEIHNTRDGLREIRSGNLTPESVKQVTDGVTALVGAAVSLLNSTGVFKQSDEQSAGG